MLSTEFIYGHPWVALHKLFYENLPILFFFHFLHHLLTCILLHIFFASGSVWFLDRLQFIMLFLILCILYLEILGNYLNFNVLNKNLNEDLNKIELITKYISIIIIVIGIAFKINAVNEFNFINCDKKLI